MSMLKGKREEEKNLSFWFCFAVLLLAIKRGRRKLRVQYTGAGTVG